MPIRESPKSTPTPPSHPLRRAWQALHSRWWSRRLVDLFVVFAVLSAVGMYNARDLLPSGGPPPTLRLKTMDGESVDLADLRGKPVVLAFWAPWCGVCRVESDNLSRVHDWAGERVEVISVAVDYADTESVKRFMDSEGVTYPVLLGDGNTVSDFRLSQFPTTYFIGADGRIRRSSMGYTTTFGLLVRALF